MLCFQPTDNYAKVLSVNFHPTSRSTGKHEDRVAAAEQQLTHAVNQLNQVYRNQHYQMARDNSHRMVLQNTETKIKWTGAAKFVLVVTLAFMQLWIMKSFLKKSELSY